MRQHFSGTLPKSRVSHKVGQMRWKATIKLLLVWESPFIHLMSRHCRSQLSSISLWDGPRAWILDIYFTYFKKKTKALICFFEKERLFGKDEEKSGEDIGEHPAGF